VEDVVPELSESSLTESPVDPKSSPSYRLAKATAIALGVAIAVIIGVMIYGLWAGWGHQAAPAAVEAKPKNPVTMTLASGYRILSSDTQPGRLILHVRSDTQDAIWVIDTTDGHIVAVVHGEAPKQ
jgi:hypothetical protein